MNMKGLRKPIGNERELEFAVFCIVLEKCKALKPLLEGAQMLMEEA